MSTTSTVIAGVVAGGGVIVLAVLVIVGRLKRVLRDEVRKRFSENQCQRVELFANFFGLESRGMKQIRGNGALVLTRDELWFLQALPRREVRVPLNCVERVSTPRSHLGKTIWRRLLRVDFQTEDGHDAAAWAVRKVEDWRNALEAATDEN